MIQKSVGEEQMGGYPDYEHMSDDLHSENYRMSSASWPSSAPWQETYRTEMRSAQRMLEDASRIIDESFLTSMDVTTYLNISKELNMLIGRISALT